ncbi:hypothetical protein T08_2147 [Trichinella sp. T8]|nr:hypothetical protein T08_2147 [Trichinella sp. T8]
MNLKQLTDTQRAHCELRTVMYNTLEFEINQTARRNMLKRRLLERYGELDDRRFDSSSLMAPVADGDMKLS